MVDLGINIGNLQLKNPVMTASGTFGYGTEFSDFFDISALGGIIIKGTTLHHREGNPYPRMAETPAGMLNAVGLQNKGVEYFEKNFIPKFSNITIGGLLLTLVIIFSFQGHVILENPLHILLIAIPLTIQTFFIFFVAYIAARLLKLPHNVAAPAGMIGASNFFELAVAVAIALFGTTSPVALATIVGVLVEVPVMLILVKIANNTKAWFES